MNGGVCPRLPDKHLEDPLLPQSREGRGGTSSSLADRNGWVGDYPKWDELMTLTSRSPAGSIVEWHHDANGQVETGSAPL